jgi:hypothetical protein
LKLCQLDTGRVCETTFRDELWSNRALYLDQLAGTVERLRTKLGGIRYKVWLRDFLYMCAADAHDCYAERAPSESCANHSRLDADRSGRSSQRICGWLW